MTTEMEGRAFIHVYICIYLLLKLLINLRNIGAIVVLVTYEYTS